MAQKEKLEQVLELLLSENQEKAAELAHEIIVETARNIYESMMEAEEIADETEDFTSEIESDESEIASDEENDGELEDEEDAESGEESEDGAEEQDVEDRVEDLEAQLAELRAEFDALMDEELEEPNHADLQATVGDDDSDASEFGGDDLDSDADVHDPEEMFERRMSEQLQVAPQAKKGKKETRVAEETQFLNKVADTGQRGTAKLAGTGNKSSLGAENTKSPYTNPPSKKDYGGKPVKFGSGTGGEYGKYNGETAEDGTITDNLGVEPKRVADKADATPKYTGGKAAGDGGNKSPVRKQD